MSEESPPTPIRPLHDVWLKPRRVFRELAATPLGTTDYCLGAAQGVVSWFALSRAQNAGAGASVEQIIVLWLLTALLAGEAAFLATPRPDTESFLYLLLQVQVVAHTLLIGWSLLLQVMGLSEVLGLVTRRALGLWLLGQLIVALAMLLLATLIVSLGASPKIP